MRTSRGLERFNQFTDGVVAIAITLMVLPLVDTVSDSTQAADGITHLLGQNGYQLFSFVLSFLVIARLWLTHQAIFEWVELYDSRIIWCGFAWMFTIVALPFTTTLIAEHPQDRLAIGLYIGDMLLSSACLSIITLVIARDPSLRHAEADVGPDVIAHSIITTSLFAVALAVAVILPQIGLWALLILFFTKPVATIERNWRSGTTPTRGS